MYSVGIWGWGVFDGIIDDLSLWDIILSPEDVKELYEGRSVGELWPNYSANLQGLWHLSGTTDSSSNEYNLTNNNVVTFIPGSLEMALTLYLHPHNL